MDKIYSFIFVLVIFAGPLVKAELSYGIAGGVRSYPFGASVGGDIKASQFLWGEAPGEKGIMFGLIQESLVLASHGMAGAQIDVYPISIVKLSYGQSVTQKYYEIKTLDCDKAECPGTLHRAYFKAAFVLGYENFLFLPQWQKTLVSGQSSQRLLGLEDEYLLGGPESEEVEVQQTLFGYKYHDSVVGLFVRKAKTKKVANESLSQYFVWQMPLNNIIEVTPDSSWQILGDTSKIKLNVGIGLFKSNWANEGFSALVGFKWGGGQDPALF